MNHYPERTSKRRDKATQSQSWCRIVKDEFVLPPSNLFAPLALAFAVFPGYDPNTVDSMVYSLEKVGILKRFDSVMSTLARIPAISRFSTTRHAIADKKYRPIT